MKNKKNITNSKLFKDNLREYLNSHINLGGLYGLTVDNPEFLKGLIKVIDLGLVGKKYTAPPDPYYDEDDCMISHPKI